AEVEAVVEAAAVVALVHVDEAGAVLGEEWRAVLADRGGLCVADRGGGVRFHRAAPRDTAVDRGEPKRPLLLQVGCRAAEVEVDRPVWLAHELRIRDGRPAGDDCVSRAAGVDHVDRAAGLDDVGDHDAAADPQHRRISVIRQLALRQERAVGRGGGRDERDSGQGKGKQAHGVNVTTASAYPRRRSAYPVAMRRSAFALLAATVLLAGCGGGGKSSSSQGAKVFASAG